MKQFSCCIIGEDTLLIECGEILLKKGHIICGIASLNIVIKQWADEHHIPCVASIVDLQKSFGAIEFDYLFSIANGKILRKDLLQAPRKFSINYHYSMLPKYAGTYATSWAILNGETTHGVTWHVMTEEVDAGDVLKQIQFPIDENETALTLNLKCYEYAIKTFIELIDELENNKFTLTKQDITLRNYSLLEKRPPYNGVIVWDRSAEEINRLCRALTFGSYLNQLTLPKFIIDNCVYNIQESYILNNPSKEKAGTVVAIYGDELRISTLTYDIAISKITNADGVLYTISQLSEKHNIEVGYKFPNLKHEYLTQLENTATTHARYENFWVETLTKMLPGKELFYVSSKSNSYLRKISTVNVPESIYVKFLENQKNDERQHLLVAIVLIYFFRLNNCENFTAKFSWPELAVKNLEFEQFFSSQLPLTSHFDLEMTFKEALDSVLVEIGSLKKHHTYARDIKIRYPQLAHCLGLNLMTIEIVKDLKAYQPKERTPLNVAILEDGARVEIFVDESLYTSQYLSVLFKNTPCHIISLMRDIIDNPKQEISRMQFLSPLEKQHILYDWNNTKVADLPNKLVHELFEEQVIKTPNNIAIICQDKAITFQDLNEKANQLAHYLRKFAVIFDIPIAICAERSIEMVVGILAILKAQGAYVPLDPSYPAERLSLMLEDSKAPILLITHSHLKHNFQSYNGQIVDLEKSQEAIIAENRQNLEITTGLDSLVYVIYTSGTTGKPKGVAITHRSLVNHMHWMIPKFNFKESDVFLQKTSLSFDASAWELLAPLLCGGKLVVATDNNPNGFCRLIQQHEVTILQLVPSVLRQLLEDNEFQLCHSLQQVFAGGEALLPDLVNLFFTKIKAKLHNLYGPTEATIQTITYSYKNRKRQLFDGALIGKPIDNTQAYVLDKCLNLVPVGLTGELYLGGTCLARGYLHQESLTLERFIQNPFFSRGASERLYKTGDIVRWLPDGNLQYIRRIDDQIKLHGLRIELGEIEACLMQHKGIQTCAVIMKERSDEHGHLTGNKYLVVFYVKKIDLISLDTEDYVKSWEVVYQSRYSSLDINNFKKNIDGWISSYTGKMIESEQLLEWVDNTVARIKQLKPKIVLEIGSGSGLILFNLLDSCQYYYATDFSKNVIDYTNKVIQKNGCTDKVSAIACAADQLPYKVLDRNYDTVIINSVVQYFPSIEYLEKVIMNAISNMKHSGKIFLGDIRDYRLLKCFHYSVQAFKQEKITKAKIDYFSIKDKELLVSPEYFIHLKEINPDNIFYVELLPKDGLANNEMNNYRYDVILHIRKNEEPKREVFFVNELDFFKIHDFKSYIFSKLNSEYICIKYPNSRILKDYIAYDEICNNNSKITLSDVNNILSIREIVDFSNSKDMAVKFFIDIHDPLYLNIILFKKDFLSYENIFISYNQVVQSLSISSKPVEILRLLENQFASELKEFLSTKLPSYMIPKHYVPLEKMPLNNNGKLDRKSLIENECIENEDYVAPRDDLERNLCQIWARVLGLPEDRIGIKDDFFNLGGHSLSALKVLVLVNKTFATKLQTSVLFGHSTVEKFAEFIQELRHRSYSGLERSMVISPIVALQSRGNKTPLFLIHPLGGTAFWYRSLAKYLGKDRPIYAIEDPSIGLNEIIFKDIPEMASYYLKLIRNVQPKGPYLIAGASLGGTISIEIAKQMLDSGEEVNFVGLMDARPSYSEKFWDKDFLKRLMLGEEHNNEPSEAIKQNLSNLPFLLSLYHQRSLMLRGYKLPIINAKIVFFQAREVWPVFKEVKLPLDCWQGYSSQSVEIHMVPGNHESMFNELNVKVLAKKIEQVLSKLEFPAKQVPHYEKA